MPEIKIPKAYRVDIIESERGYGQKIDEVKYFDNEEEAKNFVAKYNSRNTAIITPDWYMHADYRGKVWK